MVDLCWAEIPLVSNHLVLVVETHVLERQLTKLPNAVRLAGGNHEVVGLLVLQDPPHRLHIVAGEGPITACLEIPRWGVSCFPAAMAATPEVIFLVTKFSPRQGLSRG